MSKKAMKLALDEFKHIKQWCLRSIGIGLVNENVLAALEEALAKQKQGEPVAKAWAEGYRMGIADERTSEANIGIAGFNAKVEPDRQNPYGIPQPKQEQGEPVAQSLKDAVFTVLEGFTLDSNVRKILESAYYTTPPQPAQKPLTDEQKAEIVKNNTVEGYHGDYYLAFDIIDDVEAAHGIKE